MSIRVTDDRSEPTLADLMAQIGSVPLERIPARPAPGTATEADVAAGRLGEKRLFELVDGVLVEKPMGYFEALLAALLIQWLGAYVHSHDRGFVMGADATLRLQPGLVRLPDVSFVSWDRFPDRELPAEAVPDLAPDLAVEILSEGNTPGEMSRKLREYFDAGCRMVWYVDPATHTARSYTSPEQWQEIDEDGVLDGGEVVPGFALRLGDWLGAVRKRRSR